MIRRLLCASLLALALVPSAEAQIVSIQPLQTSGIANATVTRNQAQLPTPCQGSLELVINILTAGTATGTLQIWIEDSVDAGTTWDDLVSSLTYALGAGATTQRFFISGDIVPSTITTAASSNITQGSVQTQEALAAGSARQGPFGDRLRVREKISGASGSPAGANYYITGVCK